MDLGDDQLHLFKIDNLIDGALFDKGKTKSFVVNEEAKLIIEKINLSKKQVYLKEVRIIKKKKKSITHNYRFETQAFQLKFFTENKVGDSIECIYKDHKEKLGHFFSIYKGFDGFLYDPDFTEKNYVVGNRYELIIHSINKSKRQVTLKRKK